MIWPGGSPDGPTARRAHHNQDQKVSQRDRACMQLLTDCNMRCRFCDLPRRRQRLAPEVASDLVDQFIALGVQFFDLTGGEPLLYEGLDALVAHVKDRGGWCSVTTNGLELTQQRAERLADAGLDALQMSVDGIGETHDRLRGRRGAFDGVRAALPILSEFPRQRNLAVVLTDENADELPDIEALAVEYELGFWFTLAAAPTDTIASTIRLPSPEALERVRPRMRRSRSREKLGWIVDALRSGACGACKVPDIRYTVLADGTLAPCAFLPGHGDLAGEPADRVDRTEAFREACRRARSRAESVCDACYIWATR